MKILIILTSHDELGNTGQKTGFWLEEFAAPFFIFTDAGADITVASPAGGEAPIDPNSESDEAQTEWTKRFYEDDEAQRAVNETIRLSTIDENDFDAVFYPGGHGPLWDLSQDGNSQRIILNAFAKGLPLGVVCHAPAVFQHAKVQDGTSVISGIRVTGFSNAEEEEAGLVDVVPFLVEDMLKADGGIYEKGEDGESYVVVDGKLVTGQNPASSAEAAKELLNLI